LSKGELNELAGVFAAMREVALDWLIEVCSFVDRISTSCPNARITKSLPVAWAWRGSFFDELTALPLWIRPEEFVCLLAPG